MQNTSQRAVNRLYKQAWRLVGLGVIALCGLQTGCQSVSWWGPAVPQAPSVLQATPTAKDIALAISQNSQRVEQLESHARVSVQSMPAITGKLAFERPRRLRLQAKLLGVAGPGVDVGSNDEQFWIWLQTSMAGQAPLFLHANHQEFAATLSQQRTPIKPEWLIDAMGLIQIDPQAQLEGPIVRADKTWEIRLRTWTESGWLTRVLVVDQQKAWVLEQQWYDANNRVLAIAKASDFAFYPGPDVSMPRRVELTVGPRTPDQLTLTLQMADHRINQLSGDPSQLWAMPQPNGVQTLDIGKPGMWMLGGPGDSMPSPPLTTAPSTNTPTASFTPQYRGRVYR